MEKKKKEKKGRKFKLPKRKQPVFNFFKKIFFGPIYRAKVESEIKVLPDKAVIASIHSAKSGPMSIAVSYPKFCAIWGHGAMLGSYRDRFKYLRNVLYIQKMHKNKQKTIKNERFFDGFLCKNPRWCFLCNNGIFSDYFFQDR